MKAYNLIFMQIHTLSSNGLLTVAMTLIATLKFLHCHVLILHSTKKYLSKGCIHFKGLLTIHHFRIL